MKIFMLQVQALVMAQRIKMIEEFKIEGIESTIKCFDNLERDLLNPKEPLDNSADFMAEEAENNFSAKGRVFGETWPPLTPTTLAIKEKLGYGHEPIMVRTGLLGESFAIQGPKISNEVGEIEVYNPVSYAVKHQLGVGKLPRRVLLKLAQRQRDEITKIFFDWVMQRIRKSFSS